MDWDQYFISEAYLAANKSKDTSTQVGAVIVGPDREIVSKGYNGPCRGEDDADPAIYERPLKYSLFEHAERNAVFNCARIGVSSKGCTMYCTWGPPCAECARAIIQSGVVELVHHAEFPAIARWTDSQRIAAGMLSRRGIRVRSWSGVPLIATVLADGRIHRLHAEAG